MNPSFHSKSKYIDVIYLWTRDVLDEKLLQLEKIHTDKNVADMLIKRLLREKQNFYRRVANMYGLEGEIVRYPTTNSVPTTFILETWVVA